MPDPGRTRQSFPSRQYRHTYKLAAGLAGALAPGGVYRFVQGRDAVPVRLNSGDAGLPQDLFATQVLFAEPSLPLTLRALRARLDTTAGAAALTVEHSFVVADGGQIPWTLETDDLQRSFRLAITRQRASAAQPDVLISASTALDSDAAFLQVIGWDEAAGAYQFYDRRSGSWFWAGSSWDALPDDTRGQGPFDSHVNGALNMKELKRPWVHWHSEASAIRDDALAPDDPLRAEPLWTRREQAEEFERSTGRPGIERWTRSRFERSIRDGRLEHLPWFMRQVLETSTINLASSPVSNSALQAAAGVQLPLTFFFNSDALLGVLDLEPDIELPQVEAGIYRQTLAAFDVAITDGQYRFAGDTHFVFVVPESAFEDIGVLEQLIERGVLSPKLAASLLMVDFPNAVFSPRRASLMRYVPEDAATADPAALEHELSARLKASPAAADPATAEAELLANLALADTAWKAEFENRLERFMTAARAQLGSAASFAHIFELAESRRREFRKRKLAEFRLTTPITNVPENASLLEFAPDGSVRQKT